ncbi:lamin tail domain-containing protein [Jatrophihabitans sp.]|uniref:lamin tail domain-containing protein n=1 Tax=Jatrophihabitans sp. TaxID=1932789 RepID=UPI0030C6B1BD|nr:Endonuclease/exonuclease/phosphatase [Jatrophihabitans sp.]
MLRKRPVATAAVLTTVAVVAALAVTVTTAQATPSTGVVLSEVYGGGGNSGAQYTNDFIELTNRGSAAVDLTGWTVQYISASPGATTTWQSTALVGSIAAGASYLVQEAAGAASPAPLPTPQATGTINLSGTSGTVAVTRTSALLTCKTAADCAADSDIADLVGYGTAVVHEGTADAPLLSNTTSAHRSSAADTDQNGTDFTAAAPTPTSGGTGGGGGSTQPGPLRIHDIQGSSWLSPVAGQSVTNVPGIVTGLRTGGSSKGYWLQDPNPDSNPATSEGIFVYTGSAPTVSVGDSVLVSGKVSDYYPLASGDSTSSTSNLSVTEIGTSSTTVLSSGNPVPAPILLTPTTVPSLYAPDLGGANIESTPITPTRSALDYYESIEGMLVEVDDARVVGPSDSYGEQYITTKPSQQVSYRGGTLLQAENATPSGRLEVVPADGSNPEVNVGDVFTGATVGPIDYSQYGGYLIAATTLGTVQHNNLPPVVATAAKKTQLSVATYNVENLAPSDPQSKYDALAHGVVTNLASPDVVALEEVQDNSGATDDGTVAADATIAKLTGAIKAAGGPSYSYREIDPANDADGGQPGGNIRVVFLFDPKRVSFVDAGKAGVNRTTTGTTVSSNVLGKPTLSLSPGRIDPTNPIWSSSRKPLVGEFKFNGKDVFVIANHFDAKLGDQNADGRFQYPTRSSEVQRAGQAAAVHQFVSSILAIKPSADVVVVGDLNDYQFSPALNVLKYGNAAGTGKSDLTDLITTLPANQQYTYDYDGISEVLDHILVSPKVAGVKYQVVHVNSEYANQTSDHDPQVLAFTP